ncbi:PHD [Musa troglodytarum]|uniref:PHD n=1 Tax=Musa troglodytarum TaxID=320322 RepID=A0A9E7FF19_9LILI|nr:PHD [Musa troglodytarum]
MERVRLQQQNMDLLGWSHSNETGKKSVTCEVCPLETPRTFTVIREEESKSADSSILELSSCTNISRTSDMCMSFLHKMDGYVYKRRKLQKNGVALMSKQNVSESTKEGSFCHSSISCEDNSLSDKNDNPYRNKKFADFREAVENGNVLRESYHLLDHRTPFLSQKDVITEVILDPNCVPNNRSIGENKVHTESPVKCLQKSESDYNSGINDRFSTSKSNNNPSSYCIKNEVDTGECSSLDNVIADPLGDFRSAKELCIFVLRTNGLLRGACESGAWVSPEVLDHHEPTFQSCKICCQLGQPLKMLICDLCEEAFHVSCCRPKIRNLPFDEWFCQSCFSKKPKSFIDEKSGKTCTLVDELPGHRRRASHRVLDPIAFMLRDSQPYTTGARIGKDFQAEVPDRSGPIPDDFNPYGEPSEVDPAEYSSLSVWNNSRPPKSTSIGNWVQCREVVYTGDDDEGTVCRKWRRAPLFVVQTDDWDCSCAVLWDPIHADCAVPQELETEVVLKHLKFIEMLRPRLASRKQKFG